MGRSELPGLVCQAPFFLFLFPSALSLQLWFVSLGSLLLALRAVLDTGLLALVRSTPLLLELWRSLLALSTSVLNVLGRRLSDAF